MMIKKKMGKIKFLLIVFLLVSCVDSNIKPYPGKNTDHEECKYIWSLGWDIDTVKCDKSLSNPKFKIGQSVMVDDSRYYHKCKGVITGYGYAYGLPIDKQEVFYYVDIKCGSINELGEEYLESTLKAVRRR